MSEPRLTDVDIAIWDSWTKLCIRYSRTKRHVKSIETAMAHIRRMAEICSDAYVACSGGKDSTALVGLVSACGVPARVMSIKDDLDFPGEEEHVRQLCSQLGMQIDIIHPPFSLQDWIMEHGRNMSADDDFHGRGAAFSSEAFYRVIDEYRKERGMPGVYLGLRKSESYGRKMNRATRGVIYKKFDGEIVCQPLCDWTGMDVFAYILSSGLPILPVYKCCRFHKSPERIRKSWWLPGSHSRMGGMIWLKSYWPSLFDRLCEILPDSARLA